MEQPIDPAKVDKGAEVRDVLDRAFAHLSLVQFGKDFFPKLVAVLFQDDPARNDDVSAGLVQFNDPELVGLSDKGIHVGYLAQIDLRAGQKGIDAEQVDDYAALDPPENGAFHDFLAFERFINPVPDAQEIRPRFRKNELAFAVFDLFQKHFDLIAHLELGNVLEFVYRKDAFGLEINVYKHFLVGYLEDPSLDDFAFFNTFERLFICL